MKRILFLFSCLSGALALSAQSVEQAAQEIYYERYQTAENTLHQYLQKDPNNASAWYYLTKDYILENKLNKAIDTIQHAPDAAKEDPWYIVAYVNILLQKGKKYEANNYFNNALKETK
jgi:predicted Zn-dependent protease